VSCFFLLNGHHSTASINWRNPGRQVLLTTRIHLLWQVIEWFADYAQVRLSGDLSISVRRFSSPAGAMHPVLSGVVLCFSRETDDLHEPMSAKGSPCSGPARFDRSHAAVMHLETQGPGPREGGERERPPTRLGTGTACQLQAAPLLQ
jgi:hypothetical protein